MTFQYASDLHLEFPKNAEYLRKFPLQPRAAILILAGDVVPFTQMERFGDFWDYLADNFEHTYWLPGNHEYYKSDLSDWPVNFHQKIRPNIILLNNESIVVDDTRFLFSTMWSHISMQNRWHVERGLSDFRLVMHEGKRLDIDRFNKTHEACLTFLQQENHWLGPHKKVVITHHVPTLKKYPARYKGDALIDGFAVELFDLITQRQPHAWIYGHHHENTAAFRIGKTRLLTNQLGYLQSKNPIRFDPKKVCTL
jgi:predicted phosphohydrolase